MNFLNDLHSFWEMETDSQTFIQTVESTQQVKKMEKKNHFLEI